MNLSTLFIERVETSISVRERQGDEGWHRENYYTDP